MRIVNDGEPNAEYYIDGKQVTQEEILKYNEDNPKTKVEFLPLEVSWLNQISRVEAVIIAQEYWERYNIEENGYIILPGHDSWAPSSVYVVVMKGFVLDHFSTIDEIWIDVNTGEAIVPHIPDDTVSIWAVSAEEARSIASAYWKIEDGAIDGACGTTIVKRIVVLYEPSSYSKYYNVAWQLEYYSNDESGGVSENKQPYRVDCYKYLHVDAMTGACIPYYVEGDGK